MPKNETLGEPKRISVFIDINKMTFKRSNHAGKYLQKQLNNALVAKIEDIVKKLSDPSFS
jgi:hypothetical protein